jgi:HEPN domain-containing protein
MSLSNKEVRKIVGFTFSEVGSDPKNWMRRAREFKEAAELIAKANEYTLPIPYYFNAALSLELILKAIAIAQGKSCEDSHRLKQLCKLAGLTITKDQESTLELLSEIIVWSGRYPVPKKEGNWDNYHDVVLEKHIVCEREGNVGRTLKNEKTFPTLKNYSSIWRGFEEAYVSLVGSGA